MSTSIWRTSQTYEQCEFGCRSAETSKFQQIGQPIDKVVTKTLPYEVKAARQASTR